MILIKTFDILLIVLWQEVLKLYTFEKNVKFNENLLTLIKTFDILLVHCKKCMMIFENWAKCQFNLVRNKINKRLKKSIYLRVWSWLRINAGGMPKTCKSNEVAQQKLSACTKLAMEFPLSGRRVSNTWVIYPRDWNNSWKRLLIPNNSYLDN